MAFIWGKVFIQLLAVCLGFPLIIIIIIITYFRREIVTLQSVVWNTHRHIALSERWRSEKAAPQRPRGAVYGCDALLKGTLGVLRKRAAEVKRDSGLRHYIKSAGSPSYLAPDKIQNHDTSYTFGCRTTLLNNYFPKTKNFTIPLILGHD